jgi:hypothetical protein
MTTYKIESDRHGRPSLLLCTEEGSGTVSISVASGSTQTVFSISRNAFSQLAAIAATISQETV